MNTLFAEMVRADHRPDDLTDAGTVSETVIPAAIVRAEPGTLGPRNSEKLGRELAAFSGPDARVIVDLSLVEDIDEAGCGVILTNHRRLADAGGCLTVYGLSRPVRLRFQVARMHRRVQVFNTEREAIGSFQR